MPYFLEQHPNVRQEAKWNYNRNFESTWICIAEWGHIWEILGHVLHEQSYDVCIFEKYWDMCYMNKAMMFGCVQMWTLSSIMWYLLMAPIWFYAQLAAILGGMYNYIGFGLIETYFHSLMPNMSLQVTSFHSQTHIWWSPESYGYPQSSSILIGFSLTKTIHFVGYPHGHGTPHMFWCEKIPWPRIPANSANDDITPPMDDELRIVRCLWVLKSFNQAR